MNDTPDSKEPNTISAAELPRFLPASEVARQLGICVDVLVRMSEQRQFARYYLFGRRKFYRADEVVHAIKNQVPGDPERYWRVVSAIDAKCAARSRCQRRPGARR